MRLQERWMFSSMRCIATIAILLFLGGCTGSRMLTEKPASLHAINEVLNNRWALIAKLDGRRIRNIRDVTVGSTYTRYQAAGRTEVDSLLTSEIQWVALPASGKIGPNVLLFASPGLILMGLGGLALAGADSESESMAAGIVGYSFALLGAGAAILGAAIGAVVGGRAAERHPVVVYEGPLSRYVDP